MLLAWLPPLGHWVDMHMLSTCEALLLTMRFTVLRMTLVLMDLGVLEMLLLIRASVQTGTLYVIRLRREFLMKSYMIVILTWQTVLEV